MLKFPKFPRFYCGISTVSNWAEGKEDKYEAPIEFVEYIIKEYDANPEKFESENWQENPKFYVYEKIKEWFHSYANAHVQEFVDSNNVFDVENFRDKNQNYFILTNVKYYTDKFTNKEDDIDMAELMLLSHNENKDLKVKTSQRTIDFNDYVFNYVVEEEDDFDDLFDDFFNESESADDYEHREQDANKCYWLYNDDERVSNDPIYNYNLDQLEEQETEEDLYLSEKETSVIVLDDSILINLIDKKKNAVTNAFTYLSKFSTDDKNAYKLLYRDNTGIKCSKHRIKTSADFAIVRVLLNEEEV
jgi:hypothetical protein